MTNFYTHYVYLAFLALLPGLLIVYFVYRRDIFPEPPKYVFITLVLGFSTQLPLDFLIPIVELVGKEMHKTIEAEDFYSTFIRAAFLEESLKYVIVIYYCLRLKNFGEPMDAIVYGVAASLGFAIMENWDYVMSEFAQNGYESAKDVAFLRINSAVLIHSILGIMMGFFLMDSIFEKQHKKLNLFLALFFPICLHGFYNYIIVSENISDAWIYLLIIFFLIRVFFIFKKQKKLQLENTGKHTKTIPPHSDIVFSLSFSLILLAIIYKLLN